MATATRRPPRLSARPKERRGIEAPRLSRLPAYVFAELDRRRDLHRARGADVIDLGMGNPDLPIDPSIVEAMKRGLEVPANHRYPTFNGLPAFREAAARWCRRQYGVTLDPETEVLPLQGSKEGLVHLAMAIVGPGDVTLVPQPAYPAHFRGTLLADATPYAIPQRPAADLLGRGALGPIAPDDLLPDLDAIPVTVLRKARLLILSYPTNPTAYCAPIELFQRAVALAREHDLVLVHDFAYAEIYFDGFKPPSLLALPGARDVAVEFHTFSKTFSMAGWRLGFVTGNAAIVAALTRFKTNCDYGIFQALQGAGVAALSLGDEYLEGVRRTYARRRDLVIAGLERLGWRLTPPRATMYLWVPAPPGMTGAQFAMAMLEKTGAVVAPGEAFGAGGDGHVRFALVDTDERLAEMLQRMERAGLTHGG